MQQSTYLQVHRPTHNAKDCTLLGNTWPRALETCSIAHALHSAVESRQQASLSCATVCVASLGDQNLYPSDYEGNWGHKRRHERSGLTLLSALRDNSKRYRSKDFGLDNIATMGTLKMHLLNHKTAKHTSQKTRVFLEARNSTEHSVGLDCTHVLSQLQPARCV